VRHPCCARRDRRHTARGGGCFSACCWAPAGSRRHSPRALLQRAQCHASVMRQAASKYKREGEACVMRKGAPVSPVSRAPAWGGGGAKQWSVRPPAAGLGQPPPSAGGWRGNDVRAGHVDRAMTRPGQRQEEAGARRLPWWWGTMPNGRFPALWAGLNANGHRTPPDSGLSMMQAAACAAQQEGHEGPTGAQPNPDLAQHPRTPSGPDQSTPLGLMPPSHGGRSKRQARPVRQPQLVWPLSPPAWCREQAGRSAVGKRKAGVMSAARIGLSGCTQLTQHNRVRCGGGRQSKGKVEAGLVSASPEPG